MTLSTAAITCALATMIASVASANYFANFQYGANHYKPLGASRSPTVDDLRATGDSKLGAGKTYAFNPKDGHWHEVKPKPADKNAVAPDAKAAPTDSSVGLMVTVPKP